MSFLEIGRRVWLGGTKKMAIELTWSDVAATVAEIMSKESAKPNRSLFLTLGNEFLAIVAEQTECYHKVWTDDPTGGELNIEGNSVDLPVDLIRITRVEWDKWDSSQVEYQSEASLDARRPTWRNDTGNVPAYYTISGNRMLFDVTPASPNAGKLTVRGVAYLPELSDDPSDPNPLAYLPVGLQRSVADYILASLPYDPTVGVEAARQARHGAKVQLVIDRLRLQRELKTIENEENKGG